MAQAATEESKKQTRESAPVLSRKALVALLCAVAALSLVPHYHDGMLWRSEDWVTASTMAMAYLGVCAIAAMLGGRIAAGIIILFLITGAHVAALMVPPYFVLDEVIWGLTPPLMLALWHCVQMQAPVRSMTWVGSGLWVAGFAVKFFSVRGWRL